NAQLLPELRGAAQAVALEPLAQRRVVLRIRLDLPQRRKLRLRGGVLAFGGADGFRRLRARSLPRDALHLPGFECPACRLQRAVDLREARCEPVQCTRIGLGERLPLGVDALAPLSQRLGGTLEVRAVRLLEREPALG